MAPFVIGRKITLTSAVCPGLRTIGRTIGDSENPVPVTETELTVTAAVPLEVNVKV